MNGCNQESEKDMKNNEEVNQERWVGIGFFTIIALIVILAIAQNAPSAEDKPATKVTDDFKQLDSDKWHVRSPNEALVGVKDGELILINRGYVFSKRQVVKKVTITLDWAWKDRTKNDQKFLYADHLLVLLRSTGEVNKARSYESLDGLRVRIIAGTGAVRLEKANGEKEGDILKEELLPKEAGQPALASDTFHNIVVSDDGTEVIVSVNGKEALKHKYKGEFKGKLLGIANRESVGFPHESRIKNIALEFVDK